MTKDTENQKNNSDKTISEFDFDVATIAIGKKYRSWAITMIETLRNNGGYNGKVHVITDLPKYYKKMFNVETVPVPFSSKSIINKTYKTRLFDLIQADKILYIDSDVVIGKPLIDWYRSSIDSIEDLKFATFKEPGMKKDELYHTGIVYMHRSSMPLLIEWRKKLESGEYPRDQLAFNDCLQSDQVLFMPKKHLIFPDQNTFKDGTVTTFVHITFTGRQLSFGLRIIKKYLSETLHVKNIPSNLNYIYLPIDIAKVSMKFIIKNIKKIKVVRRTINLIKKILLFVGNITNNKDYLGQSYEAILTSYLSAKEDVFFFQIGANDGKINDPIFPILKKFKHKTSGVLVEPQSYLMPILKENYKFHNDLHFFQGLIGDGEMIDFYVIKREYWDKLSIPYGNNWPKYRGPSGISSSIKSHVEKWLEQYLDNPKEKDLAIERQQIKTNRIKDVLNKFGIKEEINILQIDTEGFDLILIKQAFSEEIFPDIICFENEHISNKQKKELGDFLDSKEYTLFNFGENSVAIKTKIKAN